MPNRKTFDENERYDHSGHATDSTEPGDLEVVPAAMRCVRIHQFGGPEVLRLEEEPVPRLQAGELLVRVRAASVNPVDYKIRAGQGPNITERDLPLTLGRDVSGVVADAADDVEDFEIGTEIFALLDRDHGGYAEYVVVPAAIAVFKPKQTDFIASAAVPLAGLTAWQGLFDQGGLQAGQRVLIHAAAGGVGHLAVQLAKARGAYVFATASAKDLDFVASLGADVVIDHRAQRFESVANDLDVVFDLVGGETRERSFEILKKGGVLVSTLGPPDAGTAAKFGVHAKGYMAAPNHGQLNDIRAMMEAAQVRPTVSKTFALEAADEALHYLETAHPRGKVVLDVSR
jgi:NADPH:quinone reductase-like Zn-dependent oxidoreductase